MKFFKKTLSVFLCAVIIMNLGVFAVSASSGSDYTIVSPYKDVVWNGENAWGAYKGSLHSHSSYSDAEDTLAVMVKEAYNQDYDFLAVSDHGITGVDWNKTPDKQLLYTYQPIIGNPFKHLTDEEYEGIKNGTYPLYNGTARGKKMVAVLGANEFNNLSLTKNHVNGFFLPANVGNGFMGAENEIGYEQAIKFIHENNGLSHINHPGDWLDSNSNPDVVNDPEKIAFFGDLILNYDSCLGIEVLNERNGTTGYDRILWDNLLMYCLKYGEPVIGFSNSDAHWTSIVDSSFSVFMMEENTSDNIKKTMQSGAFFGITRKLRANKIIGPEKEIDVMNKGLPYPMFTNIAVDGHKITVSVKDSHTVQWIANGKVILKNSVTADNSTFTLDLDEIKDAENFQYVRVELFGEGGLCFSQAFIIDDGEKENIKHKEEPTFCEKFNHWFRGTKVYTIFDELIRLIEDAFE